MENIEELPLGTENNNEHLSEAKRKLLNFELTGAYVFHGSDVDIEAFEPRQAHNYIDGEKIPDGEPAIFASSKAEYAIFMAIINRGNCPKGSRSSAGVSNEQLIFGATEDTLSQLKNTASGWVYVFKKDDFSQRSEGGVEYVSFKSVQPIERIRVLKEDLPEKIKIIEEEKF